MSRIPTRYESWTLDGHPDYAAADVVVAFLKSDRWTPPNGGHGLVIGGSVGTGKTGLAIGALNWFMHNRTQSCVEYFLKSISFP